MSSLFRLANVTSFQCCCHFLNLVVKEAGLGNPRISEIVRKLRVNVTKMRTMGTKRDILSMQEELGIPENQRQKIPLDIKIRWNSTYGMIKSAVEQKDILLTLCQRGKLPEQLDRLEMNLLNRLIPVLERFDIETKNVKNYCVYFYLILYILSCQPKNQLPLFIFQL